MDQSGVYVSGGTEQPTPGAFDGFVRKYDPGGNFVWDHRKAAELNGYAWAVELNPYGQLFVFVGNRLRKLSSDGREL